MPTFDDVLPIWWFRPYKLRILIVTDGGGGFGDASAFSLGEMLKAFQTNVGGHVQYVIDTAHRGYDSSGATPTFSNFTFTQTTGGFNLMNYDELWLFGVEAQIPAASGGHPMTSAEVEAVAAFMNAGRGVFATGDHEDLGYNLCSQIPRVRSMRKWWYPHNTPIFTDPTVTVSPDGQPVAPSGESANRHDTLRPEPGESPTSTWAFADQSDDIPQYIQPKWYHAYSAFEKATFPHPLLCGPNGVIDVLPDHPHEGECIVPADLTKKFTLHGAMVDEYPTVAGYRPTPEVVARATVIGGHSTEPPNGGAPKPPVNSTTFGVIGAYDGTAASVGKVVVDATWHHFFGINLRGTVPFASHGTDTNRRDIGFYASSNGQEEYREIQDYYRNIALWIAPPAAQQAILYGWLWRLRWDYPIYEEVIWRERFNANQILFIGTVARNALGALASQCQTVTWSWSLIPQLVADWPIPHFPPGPPPWYEQPNEVTQVFGPIAISEAVLGGALAAIIEKFPVLDARTAEEAEKLLPQLVVQGGRRGLKAMVDHKRNLGLQLSKAVDTMERVLGHSNNDHKDTDHDDESQLLHRETEHAPRN